MSLERKHEHGIFHSTMIIYRLGNYINMNTISYAIRPETVENFV